MVENDLHFIVGCPRSGTTLLSTLIGRHSEISVPTETHFADQLLPPRHEQLEISHSYIWDSIDHREYLSHLRLDTDTVRARFENSPASFKALFVTYLSLFAERDNNTMLVEKTPDHLQCYDLLTCWFPDARFIVVVRDGRAVSQSLCSVPWASNDPLTNMRRWVSAAKATVRIAKRNERVLVLRYEDLLQEPEQQLAAVMHFLGKSLEAGQFDTRKHVANIAPGEEAWKSGATLAADARRVNAWQSEMPIEMQQRCSAMGEAYLGHFGYAVSGSRQLRFVKQKVKGLLYKPKRLRKSWREQRGRQQLRGPLASPQVLAGVFLGSLRSPVINVSPEIERSVTNCALLATSTGYLGLFKGGNFDYYSHDLGIPLPRRLGPVQQSLYEVELDHHLNVMAVAKIRVVVDGKTLTDPGTLVEDPRLLRKHDSIWGTANFVPRGVQSESRVLIFDYCTVHKELRCFEPALPDRFSTPQKNWVPIDHASDLLVQIDVHPLTIARVDMAARQLKDVRRATVAGPSSVSVADSAPVLHGLHRLSGGTPVIRWHERSIGVGHGYRMQEKRRVYYSFLYAIDTEPAPQLQVISPFFKLPDCVPVQFVSGLIYERESRSFLVSYGVADCDNYFLRVREETINDMLSHPDAQYLSHQVQGIDAAARVQAR